MASSNTYERDAEMVDEMRRRAQKHQQEMVERLVGETVVAEEEEYDDK